jgi:rhodanese-related sulfurtransferase
MTVGSTTPTCSEWNWNSSPGTPGRRAEPPRSEADLDDRLLVTFCTGDIRSAGAANLLVENGFDAVNMSGGLIQWRAAGGPLTDS